ncbi:hypothetical protein PENANT_c012G02220 [Penicillium antarcticum]|uniref:BHLH domain-containing protein n=1 Tax=Penicillium antarcticum TaxID=416450 RepID=A0A1V6Q6A8_9EURO|nr:helix-loop-helix DNA-binding domain-containing protein [Penicillium antarcticum]KAJ5297714.1 helix-loop-helix DNA-binding domain-containing protein [Penicillium antarcticum]OQD84773.1 hypothetical protein PENANT_c012G02220 [Penicillium antarcticum]
MENTNHIFDTGSCTELDLGNSFLPDLESSEGLSHVGHSLNADWTGRYQFSHEEITAPFFLKDESGPSNPIQAHRDPPGSDTQRTPEFLLDNFGVPDIWSCIDWSVVGQSGQYKSNETTNSGSSPNIESGTTCSSKFPSYSQHASPSGRAAAAERSRYQPSKRVSHYRIEKKYRANINDKIRLLDEMLPETPQHGQQWMNSGKENSNVSSTRRTVAANRSKGEVLSLVIDYIVFLRKKDALQQQSIRELEGYIRTSRNTLGF